MGHSELHTNLPQSLRASSWFLLALLLLLAGGCINLGPKYQRPDPGFVAPATYQHAPPTLATPEPEDRWWEVFQNPEVNQVVEEVLRHNLDIKKATARILEVRAQFLQVRADRFPRVEVEGQIQKQDKPVGVTAGPAGGTRLTAESTSLSFSVSPHPQMNKGTGTASATASATLQHSSGVESVRSGLAPTKRRQIISTPSSSTPRLAQATGSSKTSAQTSARGRDQSDGA